MWEAALMQNNLELAKKEWDTSAALEHGIERRVELGELAKTDLLLARDATLTKRAAYAHAQMEFEKARLSYASFTSIQRLPRRRGERRSALNTITDDHPQLAEVVAQLNQAKAGLIAVRRTGGGNLELFLGANGERDASNEDFNNRLGLGLSLPIGLNSHNKPAITAATRTLAEGKTDYEKLLRRLNLELLQAIEELKFAQAELELARERNQLNLESLRMARVAFESGETDLVGLLLVQRLAFSAERRERELHIIRQRAIARYNQAVGESP
jgi:outer membrane protein TolC